MKAISAHRRRDTPQFQIKLASEFLLLEKLQGFATQKFFVHPQKSLKQKSQNPENFLKNLERNPEMSEKKNL